MLLCCESRWVSKEKGGIQNTEINILLLHGASPQYASNPFRFPFGAILGE